MPKSYEGRTARWLDVPRLDPVRKYSREELTPADSPMMGLSKSLLTEAQKRKEQQRQMEEEERKRKQKLEDDDKNFDRDIMKLFAAQDIQKETYKWKKELDDMYDKKKKGGSGSGSGSGGGSGVPGVGNQGLPAPKGVPNESATSGATAGENAGEFVGPPKPPQPFDKPHIGGSGAGILNSYARGAGKDMEQFTDMASDDDFNTAVKMDMFPDSALQAANDHAINSSSQWEVTGNKLSPEQKQQRMNAARREYLYNWFQKQKGQAPHRQADEEKTVKPEGPSDPKQATFEHALQTGGGKVSKQTASNIANMTQNLTHLNPQQRASVGASMQLLSDPSATPRDKKKYLEQINSVDPGLAKKLGQRSDLKPLIEEIQGTGGASSDIELDKLMRED